MNLITSKYALVDAKVATIYQSIRTNEGFIFSPIVLFYIFKRVIAQLIEGGWGIQIGCKEKGLIFRPKLTAKTWYPMS